MRRTLKLEKEILAELTVDELGALVGATVRPQVFENPTKNDACGYTLLPQWTCGVLCVTPTIRC